MTRRTLVPFVAALLLVTGCTGGTGGVTGKPGAAGLRDPYFPKLGNGGYDVRHYGLTLDYDPDGNVLKGTALITAVATQDLSAFNLDLDGLTVRGAEVDGARASVQRAGRELTLRPKRDVRKGRTFTALVRYEGEPKALPDEGWRETSNGAVALGQPTGSTTWFPGNHHPSDKAAYDITVTVPNGYTAVSNGELREKAVGARTTSFVWHEPGPMASYVATVAVGKYAVQEGRAAGVPYYTAVNPELEARGSAYLAKLPAAMEWGIENFGPYPFTTTGAIVDEDPDVGYALETQTKPFLPEGTDESTFVHELAHQWFGNSVTPRTWRDMWLNEGFATYAEWLWAEDFHGRPAGKSFAEAFDDEDNWAFPPADPPNAAELSDPPVYARGAMVVHRLRELLGDDDAFGALVRGWLKEYRHANASTEDFTDYVAEHTDASDEELDELWDTWLYGEERPAPPGE
ncbi:M1 family metallopeptidase [Streptomyces sp. NPDC050504]|uniref:M1 family metallopeptidase n=1 Tax=Streptomyces sp. NPDC050504 TaxID=3365618 RepID=UPI0037BC2C60